MLNNIFIKHVSDGCDRLQLAYMSMLVSVVVNAAHPAGKLPLELGLGKYMK